MDAAVIVLWLGLLVNIFLAGVVFWYTRETATIRKQGQEQLKLLREQLRLAHRPVLLPGAQSFLRDGSQGYHCDVGAANSNPAFYIKVVLLAPGGKYYATENEIPFLPSSDGHRHASAECLPARGIEAVIQSEYGIVGKGHWDSIHTGLASDGFVAAFFRDALSNVYVAVREIEFKGQNPGKHRQPQLYEPV